MIQISLSNQSPIVGDLVTFYAYDTLNNKALRTISLVVKICGKFHGWKMLKVLAGDHIFTVREDDIHSVEVK